MFHIFSLRNSILLALFINLFSSYIYKLDYSALFLQVLVEVQNSIFEFGYLKL